MILFAKPRVFQNYRIALFVDRTTRIGSIRERETLEEAQALAKRLIESNASKGRAIIIHICGPNGYSEDVT